jgi:hypothetical protein
VGEENVKNIRRKNVFGGIFASTVSLSIFGWLGNPHDVIRSRTGKPANISTFARQVTGWNNAGFKSAYVGRCWATNTLTGLIYVGPRATHFSLQGIFVHGLYGAAGNTYI